MLQPLPRLLKYQCNTHCMPAPQFRTQTTHAAPSLPLWPLPFEGYTAYKVYLFTVYTAITVSVWPNPFALGATSPSSWPTYLRISYKKPSAFYTLPRRRLCLPSRLSHPRSSFKMSSTITSSSDESSLYRSTFHSFSRPTQWNAKTSRPSTPSFPFSFADHSVPTYTTRESSLPSCQTSDSIRPPVSSAHAFSELTRRHLSKISLVSPRESDADSVFTEPVSYSTNSYVAADMWLVHKDVDNAEKVVAKREKERERHRHSINGCSGDALPSRTDSQDMSSSLLRMFFTGGAREVPSGIVSSDKKYERMHDPFGPRHFEKVSKMRTERMGNFQSDAFGGYSKRRRFERLRRFRWWIRRMSFKIRGEAD